ncbi:MAG TPA: vancomycin high temperature exclusion protein [Crocinitomicaceae bacterium]|nr:vancomycin high temperature exclusion protein [Crocinitomicaceae bacterium]
MLRKIIQQLKTKISFKKLVRSSLLILILGLVFGFISNTIVEQRSEFTYNSITEIPSCKTGLLLGTSKYVKSGNINQYYQNRIDATVELYNAGKIKFVLISGDNSTRHYDEPTTMKEDLIARGIPDDKIFLDYAGFRTLDSVVRAKEIFGQIKLCIISQQFHNERAIYIAEKNGIDAVGFNAKSVSKRYGFKTKIREFFARGKVVLDMSFGISPKFLGKKIEIK